MKQNWLMKILSRLNRPRFHPSVKPFNTLEEAHNLIIKKLREMVPEEKICHIKGCSGNCSKYDPNWNACRAEMLKRINKP